MKSDPENSLSLENRSSMMVILLLVRLFNSNKEPEDFNQNKQNQL